MFSKNDDNHITAESMSQSIRRHYAEKQTLCQSYQSNLHRNILLIGRRNIGKTTLRNILEDPCYISDGSTLISRTPPITLHPTFSISDSNLSLSVIETSCPFEPKNTNEHLSKFNDFCIENNLAVFHLVCFCASFESGVKDEDIHTLHKLINHFGQQICSYLCLIVTRSELKTIQQREDLSHELHQDRYFKNVIPYFHRGIYFTGSITQDCYKRKDLQLLTDQFDTVYDYRKDLFKLIENSTKSFCIQPTTQQAMDFVQPRQNYSTLPPNRRSNDHILKGACCRLL